MPKNFLKRIVISVGLALGMQPLVVHGDALIIPVDVSGSTPVTTEEFQRTVLPIIGERISKLTVGSRVKVFSVGDDKVPPLEINLYVQRDWTAEGDSAKALATQVPNLIKTYLRKLKSNPELMQNESSLTPAFLDGSKWCQEKKPCTIFFLTDGMEYQPGVIAWPVEYKKPLPNIDGLNLRGATVIMYGVGQGASSTARIAIEQHWNSWLSKHNAGSVSLYRM